MWSTSGRRWHTAETRCKALGELWKRWGNVTGYYRTAGPAKVLGIPKTFAVWSTFATSGRTRLEHVMRMVRGWYKNGGPLGGRYGPVHGTARSKQQFIFLTLTPPHLLAFHVVVRSWWQAVYTNQSWFWDVWLAGWDISFITFRFYMCNVWRRQGVYKTVWRRSGRWGAVCYTMTNRYGNAIGTLSTR